MKVIVLLNLIGLAVFSVANPLPDSEPLSLES
jgi:hypothetical protein